MADDVPDDIYLGACLTGGLGHLHGTGRRGMNWDGGGAKARSASRRAMRWCVMRRDDMY
jgi:hypothetical protein